MPRRTLSHESVNRELAERSASPVQTYNSREVVPGLGNLDHTDMIVPRLKLLQGMSPETKPSGGGHPQGQWFHTTESRCLGTALTIVPLGIRKTCEVWGPRNSDHVDAGILARSSDGVHWDEGYAHKTFEILFDDGHIEVWQTKADVKSSGMVDFRDGGAPIAGYTFRVALYLPDYPQFPASLYIASRTATMPILDLHGRINARYLGGQPFWTQVYRMNAFEKNNGRFSWYVPQFENLDPLTDKRLIADLEVRSQAIYRANVVSTDEDERLQGGDDGSYRREPKAPRGRERNAGSPH